MYVGVFTIFGRHRQLFWPYSPLKHLSPDWCVACPVLFGLPSCKTLRANLTRSSTLGPLLGDKGNYDRYMRVCWYSGADYVIQAEVFEMAGREDRWSWARSLMSGNKYN